MLKKFAEGLVFGAGFSISFILIWYTASYLITPMIVTSATESEVSRFPPEAGASRRLPKASGTDSVREPSIAFHEMQIEDQIKQASVIALAKFEPSTDGKMRAIIKEFLKKRPNTQIHYNIGDEYPSSSYYPSDKTVRGDGVVIFFVGSPATMKMSMTFSDNRILGLGDLPIELFKKKCEAPDA